MSKQKATKTAEVDDSDGDFESVNSDDNNSEVSITEQVEKAIKELPTLQEKVQAIAINHHIIAKRDLDRQLEKAQYKIEHHHRAKFVNPLKEIQSIVDGSYQFTNEDFEFIRNQHAALFKQNELQELPDIASLLKSLEAPKPAEEATDDAVKAAAGKGRSALENYWLKSMQGSDIIREQIFGRDEEVLGYLTNITSERNEENTYISVSFHFAENQWFHNSILKKEIQINEKGEAERSFGDKVDWKEGQNYSVVTKKNKKKKKKSKPTKVPSFFHFFDEIDSKDDKDSDIGEEDWDDILDDLALQFELCEHLHQDLIPKSLEYYLGVAGSNCCADGNCGDCVEGAEGECVEVEDEDQN